MTEQPRVREPILGDVPAVVVALGSAILIVSALALFGPRALSDPIFLSCVLPLGPSVFPERQPLGPFAPYLLHVFVHGGPMHLALNLAGLAAFGAATARRLSSPLLFLALFALCSIAGAMAEAAIPRDAPITMLGASSGVFGLVGAATYIRAARGGVLPSLFSRRMLAGLAPWVAVNLVFAAAGGAVFGGGGGIAWVAHLGGLAAGAALFPVLDRIARSEGA